MQSTSPPKLPRSKRQRLAEALVRTGLERPLRLLHDRGRRPLVVLGYHRVMPLDGPRHALDPEIVSATPEQFAWQMRHLRDRCAVVSLQQVIEHVEAGAPLPQRAVAVTFDDGFADTYNTAFPILRSCGVPATVFATTDHLQAGDVFWFERVAQIVMTAPVGLCELEGESIPTAADTATRQRCLHTVLGSLKRKQREEREQLISRWTAQHPFPSQLAATEDSRSVNWDQLREMADGGMAVGSHTVSHPNLALLDADDLRAELADSRRLLETGLQRPVDTIAYPIGTRDAVSPAVFSAAKAAGYKLGLTYLQGINWQSSLRPFEIRRISVNPAMTAEWFEAAVSLPEWCAFGD